jgi:hypothetical protein
MYNGLPPLQRSMGLEQIFQQCKSGYLGEQIPALKAVASEVDEAVWASILGFDPFAKVYVNAETREQIQTAWDCTRRGELVDKTVLPARTVLFGISSSIYLPRSLKHRDGDVARRTVMHLLEENDEALAEQSAHDDSLTKLCKALACNNLATLVPPALTEELELHQASDPMTVFAASLAVHAVGVFTPEAMPSNPLARYACEPAAARQAFMVAAEGNIMGGVIAALGEAVTRYRCQNSIDGKVCGYTYLVANCGNTVGSSTCPQCGKTIGSRVEGAYNEYAVGQTRLDAQTTNALPDEPGYLKHDEKELAHVDHSIQRSNDLPALSRISFRTMHLLVHLSLFAAVLIGKADELQVLIDGEASPALHVWRSILTDLNMLHKLLEAHPFDEFVAFLHKLIEDLPGWCEGRTADLDTAALRNTWEREFAARFVDPVLPTMQQALQQCADEYKRAVAEPPRIAREIDEDTSLDLQSLFHPALFTVMSHPSFELLRTSFDSAPAHAQRHPFLALFLEWQPLLDHVQHLWALTRWYRMLREQWSNTMSREDAGKTAVRVLLEQANEKLKAGEVFDDFADAWNAVVDGLRHGGASIQFSHPLPIRTSA